MRHSLLALTLAALVPLGALAATDNPTTSTAPQAHGDCPPPPRLDANGKPLPPPPRPDGSQGNPPPPPPTGKAVDGNPPPPPPQGQGNGNPPPPHDGKCPPPPRDVQHPAPTQN